MIDDQTADECGICLETLTAAVIRCLAIISSVLIVWMDGNRKFGSSLKDTNEKSKIMSFV